MLRCPFSGQAVDPQTRLPEGVTWKPVTSFVGTCDTALGPFTCTVTCPGVGAIALASGDWESDAAVNSTLYLNSESRRTDDVASWDFNFGTEGVQVGVQINMTVICFTPPT